MTPDRDVLIVTAFPNLYRDRYSTDRSTGMRLGFECDDGWFELIRNLSAPLEAIIADMSPAERPDYRALQVKEKFGGLRFYMTLSTPKMDVLIADAERRSFTVCEICGKPGKTVVVRGWAKTVCAAHAAEGKSSR